MPAEAEERLMETFGTIKFECRNPKLETNSKYKCSNVQNENPAALGFGHLNLGHWILFRISCFGFRIFNFFAGCEEVPG